MKKTILITGARKGIGKAISDDLQKKEYNLSLCSRSMSFFESKQLLKQKCDVTNEHSVEKMVSNTIKKYKKIDILINNVGSVYHNPFVKSKLEDLEDAFNLNVKGAFLCCKNVLPIMRKHKQGYIINISSIRGITVAPNKTIYSMAKFSLQALTKGIQLEEKQNGIKVTAICPGLVYTQSSKKFMKKYSLKKEDIVQTSDIVKTIDYLMSLSPKAFIPEIIIGGQI